VRQLQKVSSVAAEAEVAPGIATAVTASKAATKPRKRLIFTYFPPRGR
jgi:hypothetical protein